MRNSGLKPESDQRKQIFIIGQHRQVYRDAQHQNCALAAIMVFVSRDRLTDEVIEYRGADKQQRKGWTPPRIKDQRTHGQRESRGARTYRGPADNMP